MTTLTQQRDTEYKKEWNGNPGVAECNTQSEKFTRGPQWQT